MKQKTKPLLESLNRGGFFVLRRWGSYTPGVIQRSTGGGYFLIWNGKGIVIDPGFDFLSNFLRMGGCATDINAVILTHNHETCVFG